MNPLAILKGAKVFLIIGVAMATLAFLNKCEDTRVLERDAAITANAEKVSAQANAAALTISNAQMLAMAEATAASLQAAAEARAVIDGQFAEIRKNQQEQKALLEDNKLNRVLAGRGRERVERLMNKATRERFDEVEAIFDGT